MPVVPHTLVFGGPPNSHRDRLRNASYADGKGFRSTHALVEQGQPAPLCTLLLLQESPGQLGRGEGECLQRSLCYQCGYLVNTNQHTTSWKTLQWKTLFILYLQAGSASVLPSISTHFPVSLHCPSYKYTRSV